MIVLASSAGPRLRGMRVPYPLATRPSERGTEARRAVSGQFKGRRASIVGGCAMSAALLCPIPVHIGDELLVKVWYAHESAPGVQYVATVGPVTAWETGLADVTAEGHPTGCRWWLNGRRVLFYDGFESGTLSAWMAGP